MATLAVTPLPAGGLTNPALVPAAGGGDQAEPGPGRFLVVRNASGVSVTATFRTPVAVGAVRQQAVPIPAGATHYQPIPARGGPFQAGAAVIERDPDANATVTYSAVASVTVGAFQAP